MKKITGLMLCLVLLFAPVAHAADFAGNRYLEEGGKDIGEAIFLNLADFTARWAANQLNIPTSPEEAMMNMAVEPYKELPGVRQMLMVYDTVTLTYGAYVDLFGTLPKLSSAKKDLMEAVLAGTQDYVEGVSKMLAAIEQRARSDAQNGGEVPDEWFVQIDRLFDGKPMAEQFRQHAKQLIFVFDKRSRDMLRTNADNVQKMGEVLLQTGSKQFYLTVREAMEDQLQQTQEPEAAASTLSITGQTIPPDHLNKGRSFGVKGTIQSNYLITSVTAGVFDDNGNLVTGASAAPYTYSYDVRATLDAQVRFDWLPDGVFNFRVFATDESGSSLVLVEKRFAVGSGGTASSLGISGQTIPPDHLAKGRAFGVKGTIQSNYPITSVTAGVFDDSGNLVTGASANPYAYSYNVRTTLDAQIRFDWLPDGVFNFRIIATDESGNSQVLVEKRFTVGNGGAAAPSGSLGAVRTTAPTSDNGYYYSNRNIFYASKMSPPFSSNGAQIKGNCTWYAWGRLFELTGSAPGVHNQTNIFRGNAHTWWDRNIESGKYSYGNEPRPGALAVWGTGYPGGLGHVAIVEKIENGVVYISESGWISLEFRYTDIQKQMSKGGFKGYIYVI